MKVIINEQEYEYVSDFPEGWKFVSGDYFKSPVVIGNVSLFVKRFRIKDTELPGLALMRHLSGKNERFLPRVHDLAEVTEGKKTYVYVFTEQLQGTTLNRVLEQSLPVDLSSLTKSVLSGLRSIHKHAYWFPDFTERNIFAETSGRYLLIDLDSCEHITTAPDKNMDVSKDYWALVYLFYKNVLGTSVLLHEFPGRLLNYLQVFFLIFQIKQQTAGSNFHPLTDSEYNALPAALDKVDPAIRDVFRQMFEKRDWKDYQVPEAEIEELILTKIIPDNQTAFREQVDVKPAEEAAGTSTADERKQDEKESEPPESANEDLPIEEKIQRLLRKHGLKIAATFAAILLAWWFIPARNKEPPVVFSKITPRVVERNYMLVMQGENFPGKDDPFEVLFDKIPGRIIYNSKHSINAVVPDLGIQKDGSRITLELVIKGDTFIASRNVLFRHH